jgi:hypothetical protein
VLRSAEDEEGRGGGMPAAWSSAWPAMAERARAARGRERKAAESEPARATSSVTPH